MPQVSFTNNKRHFHIEVNDVVNQYFIDNKISKRGNVSLLMKAITIYAAVFGIYATIVIFQPESVLVNFLLLTVFGLLLSLIGFNVMHDACHGSFSDNSRLNDIFGYSLNFLGAESYFWKVKHNVLHHTYTNVDGVDDDIFKPPFLRMSPNQPYNRLHRYQSYYMLLLYGVSTLFWVFYMDFNKYFTNKVYTTDLPTRTIKSHVTFWLTKLFYIVFYIAFPIYMLGFGKFIIGFFFYNMVMGITLSVVFQLAHVVERSVFANASVNGDLKIDEDWAIYQMKTTSDFCTDNKFITWAVGGLNFQIEHHLFPKVSHIHYPKIRQLVKEVASKHGITHNEFRTLSEALRSHFGMMNQLGQTSAVVLN